MKLHKEPHPSAAFGAAAIAALLVFNAVSPPSPALAQGSENGRAVMNYVVYIKDGAQILTKERVAPTNLTRLALEIDEEIPEVLGGFILMKQSVNDPNLIDEYRLTVIQRGRCSTEKSRQLQDDITLALREAEIEDINLAPRDCVEVFEAEQAKWGTFWQPEAGALDSAVVVLAAVATAGDLATLAAAAAGADNVRGAQIAHKGTSVSLQLSMVGSCDADAVEAVLEQTKLEAGRMGVDVSFGGRECLYVSGTIAYDDRVPPPGE